MSGLPFQEFAFLESKRREYSPFRNSFPASLKRGTGRRKGGHQVPAAGNANMHASWYCGVVHGTMHASCTWNYGRGAGEAMRAHLQHCIFTFCTWKGCIFTLRKWKKLDFYTSYKDLVCFYIRHIKSVQGRARASTLACCIFTASCTQGWVALVLLLVFTSIKPQLTHN